MKIKFPGLLYFSKFISNPKITKFNWALTGHLSKALTRVSVIRKNNPWGKPEYTNMYWIPVNQALEQAGDTILPQEIVAHFIDKSSHRVILDFCGCRKVNSCTDYPIDIGCLMMGEDARGIKASFSRSVTKKEAHAHLQRAVDAGLAPFVGKARIDNAIFGVPDTGRMVSVCFCDECCCLTRWASGMPGPERNEIMHRLEGLTIWVDRNSCIGCGVCIEKCFLNLIAIRGSTAHIPLSKCMGCGRCVVACPQDAIRVRLDNPDFINQAIEYIEAYVDPE
jgi:ferredoxin